MIRICSKCGKEFETKSKVAQCKPCQKQYRDEYRERNKDRIQQRYEERKAKQGSMIESGLFISYKPTESELRITEIDKEAKEKGMTYGQYQAMLYGRAFAIKRRW